jgi:hypothetical protein
MCVRESERECECGTNNFLQAFNKKRKEKMTVKKEETKNQTENIKKKKRPPTTLSLHTHLK